MKNSKNSKNSKISRKNCIDIQSLRSLRSLKNKNCLAALQSKQTAFTFLALVVQVLKRHLTDFFLNSKMKDAVNSVMISDNEDQNCTQICAKCEDLILNLETERKKNETLQSVILNLTSQLEKYHKLASAFVNLEVKVRKTREK